MEHGRSRKMIPLRRAALHSRTTQGNLRQILIWIYTVCKVH